MTRHTLGALASALLMSMGLITPALAQDPLDTLGRGSGSQRSWGDDSSARAVAEPGTTLALRRGSPMRSTLLKTPKLTRFWATKRAIKSAEIVGDACGDYAYLREYERKKLPSGAPIGRGHVVHTGTGKIVGTVDQPIEAARCLGDYFVIGTENNGLGVLHVPSASWRVVGLQRADGSTFEDARFVIPIMPEDGGDPAAVLVTGFERDLSGTKHGVYKLGSSEPITVRSMPFKIPREARRVGDTILLDVLLETGMSSKEGLVRVSGGSIEPYDAPPTGDTVVLESGHTILGNSGRILGPDGAEERLPSGGCTSNFAILGASDVGGASALLRCYTGSDTFRMVHWTPQNVATWTASFSEVEGLVGRVRNNDPRERQRPILSVRRSREWGMVDSWYDMRTGVLWRGTERYHTELNGSRTFARTLTSDVAETDRRKATGASLYLVDLDRGEERLVHRYTDCPGFLFTTSVVDDLAIVNCVTKPKGYFRFMQQWSEVVDLTTGARVRAPKSRHIEAILPGRRFVVSNLGKNANTVHGRRTAFWVGTFPGKAAPTRVGARPVGDAPPPARETRDQRLFRTF